MSNKLSKGTLKLLYNVLDTASMLGIERVVVDSHSIRGNSAENSTMMLLHFPDDTELEFGSIGIGRIPVLNQRMRLLRESGDIIPEFKTRDSGDKFVFRLELKKGRTSIDFKCSDPALIKAPKYWKDTPAFTFKVTAEDIKLMLSSKTAMGSDTVTFTSTDGDTVKYLMAASEGDTFTHALESALDKHTDTEEFTVNYSTKILFPVLKEISDAAKEADVEISITERGVLNVEVNNIPVYVIPEI